MLSRKMIESNHFSDGQFQSIISSFEPKKTFRVTQSTFGSPKSKFAATQSSFYPHSEMASVDGKPGMKRVASQGSSMTYNSVLARTGFLKKL